MNQGILLHNFLERSFAFPLSCLYNNVYVWYPIYLAPLVILYVVQNSKPYIAPFAVFLNEDDKTYVEPDISVICSPDKLNDKGCVGAPDWVIEIVSLGSRRMDYYAKLFKYRTAEVREYWIVEPLYPTLFSYQSTIYP